MSQKKIDEGDLKPSLDLHATLEIARADLGKAQAEIALLKDFNGSIKARNAELEQKLVAYRETNNYPELSCKSILISKDNPSLWTLYTLDIQKGRVVSVEKLKTDLPNIVNFRAQLEIKNTPFVGEGADVVHY